MCDWNRLVRRKSERWGHSAVQERVVPVIHPCYGRHRCDGVLPAASVRVVSNATLCATTGNLVLAVTYVLVDINHWWGGAPPKFVGMNSIVVYVHARWCSKPCGCCSSHVPACCCAATPARRSCRCTFPSRLWSTRLWSESEGLGFARTRQHWLPTPLVWRRGC